MAWASIAGRARTDPSNPEAHAICDRCGFRYNHVDLKFQFDWAGATMINKEILVCESCYDQPQEQLRAVIIPADPLPISNPRVQIFEPAEIDFRFTSGENTVDPWTDIPIIGGDNRITQNNQYRVIQQTGEPPGGLNEFPGTDPFVPASIGGTHPGLPYGFTEVPRTGPLTGVPVPVAPTIPPVNTSPPVVVGSAIVGGSLVCSPGAWDNVPTAFSFQWKADGVDISGANAAGYTPVTGDIGKSISCLVTASNAGGSSSVLSNSVGPVTGGGSGQSLGLLLGVTR